MRYLLLFLLLPLSLQASQTGAFTPKHHAVPGGVALVTVGKATEPKPQYIYNKDNLALVSRNGDWVAVVGVPLSAKIGTHKIINKKSKQTIAFKVSGHAYPEQWLTIKNKRHVNPNPADVKRIQSERGQKWRAKNRFRRNVQPTFLMKLPVDGIFSSQFGLRRFFNNQPRNPHGGLDIAAPRHTPIYAPADGKVVEAHNFFFSGNCIFIEHGMGLTTFYAHLHKIKVKKGQMVKQGDIIGTVGDTGRVTGPHLHWSIALNGNWVNPLLFVKEKQKPKKTVKPNTSKKEKAI